MIPREKMSVIVKKDGKHYIMTKGAPDMMLGNCSQILNNRAIKLTPARKKEILQKMRNSRAKH